MTAPNFSNEIAKRYASLNEAAYRPLRELIAPIPPDWSGSTGKLVQLAAGGNNDMSWIAAALQEQNRATARLIRQSLQDATTVDLRQLIGAADPHQGLEAAKETHARYIAELEASGFVSPDALRPDRPIIGEELSFAVDSIGPESVRLEESDVSPYLRMTRKDWRDLFALGALNETIGLTEYASPVAPMVIYLVFALVLTLPEVQAQLRKSDSP